MDDETTGLHSSATQNIVLS